MPTETSPPSSLPRRLLTVCAALLVILLTAAACALTWDVLRALAEAGRVDRAWSPVYPAAADALLVLTLLSLLAARHGRWWSRAIRWTLLLVLLAGLSWTAVQHAVWGYASLPAKPLRGAVAVAPHVMLLIGVWLWLTTLRLLRRPSRVSVSDATPADPVPHESPLDHLFSRDTDPQDASAEPSTDEPAPSASHLDQPDPAPEEPEDEDGRTERVPAPPTEPAGRPLAPYDTMALSSEPAILSEPLTGRVTTDASVPSTSSTDHTTSKALAAPASAIRPEKAQAEDPHATPRSNAPASASPEAGTANPSRSTFEEEARAASEPSQPRLQQNAPLPPSHQETAEAPDTAEGPHRGLPAASEAPHPRTPTEQTSPEQAAEDSTPTTREYTTGSTEPESAQANTVPARENIRWLEDPTPLEEDDLTSPQAVDPLTQEDPSPTEPTAPDNAASTAPHQETEPASHSSTSEDTPPADNNEAKSEDTPPWGWHPPSSTLRSSPTPPAD
ncbi:hypothetical protein DZF91_06150 [Actinomadura logoneensis]|uniref:DUF2637 domain-containing protein n=1 Tax=Actinomadura logoneensis TaxID=2293572 RepID=A0A372JRC0_9ACTN|nr:hypothetical protein [Actinomadura logoneensis]RFU42547.1 hypothetical protein DZF91_06150 [Actinomadura logoneensis]